MGKLGRNYALGRLGGQHKSTRDIQYSGHYSGPTSMRADIAAWILTGIALVLVLLLHMLPALLAGLLVYDLVHLIAPRLQRNLSSERARLLAVVVLSTIIVGVLTAMIIGAIAFFHGGGGNLPALFQRVLEIIESSRTMLPEWITTSLPTTVEELRALLTEWFTDHAPELQLVGKEAGRAFAQIIIGMIIGAMVSLHDAVPSRTEKPLARSLTARVSQLAASFGRVVFAQVRISLLNTIFTSIYLTAVLPAFGIHLPFTKTLIAVTFVAGLLPVIGNLISNSVIVLVSLSHSLQIALGSLAFLVIIHKLEYFLNARIIGTQIQARPWELLVAMLAMEAAFGLPGVAAAPIYYAYIKQELADRGLV